MHDDTGRGLVMGQGLLLGTHHFFFEICLLHEDWISEAPSQTTLYLRLDLLSKSRDSVFAETQLPCRAVLWFLPGHLRCQSVGSTRLSGASATVTESVNRESSQSSSMYCHQAHTTATPQGGGAPPAAIGNGRPECWCTGVPPCTNS